MLTARSLIVSPYLVVSHARPPPSPHMPPLATMHAPDNHTFPLETTHAPLATMHAPRNQACPPQPGMPPPCGQTDTCKLITLPQTSFAGGNYWNGKSTRERFHRELFLFDEASENIPLIFSGKKKCTRRLINQKELLWRLCNPWLIGGSKEGAPGMRAPGPISLLPFSGKKLAK